MEALLCTNATAASRAGLPLPSRRTSPSAAALSAPVSAPTFLRRRHSLPTRGLRCAGADWPEPSFVAVADKPDAAAAARKVQASAGAGGEEEKGRLGAINGVSGGAVEKSVAVPFEQSLVGVNSVGNDALSQALGNKNIPDVSCRRHVGVEIIQPVREGVEYVSTAHQIILGVVLLGRWYWKKRWIKNVEELHGREKELHLVLPAGEVRAVETIKSHHVLIHELDGGSKSLGLHNNHFRLLEICGEGGLNHARSAFLKRLFALCLNVLRVYCK